MASVIEGVPIPQILEYIKEWVEKQIDFNRKNQNLINENNRLRSALEAIQGTEEYRALRAAQIDRDEKKAKAALLAVEEEKKKLGLN